jgi:hypothetical protein
MSRSLKEPGVVPALIILAGLLVLVLMMGRMIFDQVPHDPDWAKQCVERAFSYEEPVQSRQMDLCLAEARLKDCAEQGRCK